MATTLGAIQYGNFSIVSDFSGGTANGLGDLMVQNNTLLNGPSTSITGTLTAGGATSLGSTLTVTGLSTLNSDLTVNALATVSGGLRITNTDDSISNTSGSIQTLGGLGVGMSAYFGGNIDVTGTARLRSNATIDGITQITNASQSTSAASGALQVAGGVGITKDLYVASGNFFLGSVLTMNVNTTTGATYLNSPGGDLYINNNGAHDVHVNTGSTNNFDVGGFTNTNATGLQVLVTGDSTSAGSGALTVAGGLGVSKSIFLGGSLTAPTGQTLTAGYGVFNNTATSTSATTGALTVAGGAGFASDVYIGGTGNVAGIFTVSNASPSTSPTSGALVVAGGAAVGENISIGGNAIVAGGLSVGGDLSFASTTDSTSTTTGAITVAGGLGIAKSVYIGGLVRLTDATGSTDSATGSFVTAGGVGIGEDLHVAGDAVIGATLSVAGNITSTGGTVTFSNTTDSTSSATGAVVVAGGIGIGKSVQIGGDLTVTGNITGSSGTVHFANTTDSTSVDTGALTVAGGLGLQKNLYVGGSAYVTTTTDAASLLQVSNSNAGAGSYSILSLANDTSQLALFLNGSGRTDDGGANTATLRNDAGGFRLQAAGNIEIGGAGSDVVLPSTADSTSTTTGALQIAGGAGISKSLNVGGTITVTNSSTGSLYGLTMLQSGLAVGNFSSVRIGVNAAANNSLTYGFVNAAGDGSASNNAYFGLSFSPKLRVYGSGDVRIESATDSSSVTTGALAVAGGLGLAKSLYMGGNLNVQAGSWTSTGDDVLINANTASLFLRNTAGSTAGEFESSTTDFLFRSTAGTTVVDIRKADGVVILSGTDDSTGANSGALQVAGGGWFGKNVDIDGNLTVAGSISSAGDMPVTFANTTDSTSTTTGAVIISGGAGIAKNLYVGGVGNFVSTEGSTSATTGGLVVTGGAGFGENIYVAGVGNFVSTAGSTDVTTGSLVTAGGAGIAENLYVGGIGNFVNAAGSTSTATGSIVTAGGAGIGENLYVGGIIYGTNAAGSTGTTTGSIVASGGLGVAENLYVGGIGNFVSTAGSTSTTTGALITAGGAGIAENLYVGGLTRIVSTAGSTSATSGALTVAGGIGIGEDAHVAGDLVVGSTLSVTGDINSTGGTVTFSNTTDSTSTTTGAVIIAGGVGIAKDISVGSDVFVGGTLNVTGNITGSGGTVNFTNTADSTSATSGALTVAGGIGIGKSVFVGGPVNIADATSSVDTLTGSFVTAGGAAIGENLNVGGSLTVAGNISSTGGTVTFTSTTDSTSSTTGAVVVAGGVGIGKALYVGSTINSDSSGTGAVVVAGGLGVALDTFLGGDLGMTGANPLFTFGNSGQALPTVATRSVGTKVLLWDALSPTTADYAFGVGTDRLWSSIPAATNANHFTWYGAATALMDLDGTGALHVYGTADSDAIGNGSLIVDGGLSVAKSVKIGQDIQFNSWTTYTNLPVYTSSGAAGYNSLQFMDDLSATAAYMGTGNSGVANALYRGSFYINATNNVILNGGGGTAGHLVVNADGTVSLSNASDSTSNTSGALTVAGGAGIAKSLFVGNNATIGSAQNVGTLTFGNGTASAGGIVRADANHAVYLRFNQAGTGDRVSTYSYGDIEFYTGGVITAQTLRLGILADGTVDVRTATNATAATNGALHVVGGAGIEKDLYVGGLLNVAGTANFASAITAATNVTAGGILYVTDTTDSTLTSNGSIHTDGGLGVMLSANIGNGLSVGGSASFGAGMTIGGVVHITDTTESNGTTTGALVVVGGVGIGKNLNVGGTTIIDGNATVRGNFTVLGTTTEVRTQTLTTTDNVIVVNAAPSGASDGGLAIKRFQDVNEAGTGDLVENDTPYETGTAGAGSTATTIVLGPGASTDDNFYNGAWIHINGGTGAGQVRRINTYAGATRTATIYTTADQTASGVTPAEGADFVTVPDISSTYEVFMNAYVVTYYDTLAKEYIIGYTPTNPVNDPNVTVMDYVPMRAKSARLSDFLAVDDIREFNPDVGVTIEGVNIKDGRITGAIAINDDVPSATVEVTLPDNVDGATVAIPNTAASGAYTLLVSDANGTGAKATFFVSGNAARGGSVFRATGTPGASNEQLTVRWVPGSPPELTFLNLPTTQTGATYTYRIKVQGV